MSQTGVGGEIEETDIISDVDYYDELDYEIKLEDNDEEEPITILIDSSNNVGVQICEKKYVKMKLCSV